VEQERHHRDASPESAEPSGTEPTAAAHGPPPASGGGRIRGIDAARALAIVGMAMVHFGPTDGDDLAGSLYRVTHGRASVLFALLAGVGVALLAGDRSPGRLAELDRRLVFRAAVLLPLGLALQMLPGSIAVILQFYALYFLVAALAARMADRWVLTVAVVAWVAGPVVVVVAELSRPGWFGNPPVTLAEWDQPLVVVRELLLTGNYPVVVWTAPVLFGVWLGRRDLRAAAVWWRMAVGGLAAGAVAYLVEPIARLWWTVPDDVGFGRLVVTQPHSLMPMWMLQATGAAVVVLVVCLVACEKWPRSTWPAVATGQVAFSVYVVHLLLVGYWPVWFIREAVGDAVLTVGRFALLTVACAVAWRAALARGPLEMLMNLPWERATRADRT
jgi:uncharacterized membrane protein YeiB